MATDDTMDEAEVEGGEATGEVEAKGVVMEEAVTAEDVDADVEEDVVADEGEAGSTETATYLQFQPHKTGVANTERRMDKWTGMEWSGAIVVESHR